MKILCLNESLIMGGQEKIFIEYLKLLENTKYDIDILIEENNGEKNIFYDEIPKKYKERIFFLCELKLMDQLEKSRGKRKNNILEKIKYSYLLKKQSNIAKAKLYKYLEKKKYDLILDFANILEPNMAIGKNIRWIHSSINGTKKNKIKNFKNKIKNSKYSVVICNEMKEEIIKKIGYQKKLVTIYNPFDFKRIIDFSSDENELKESETKLIKENYIVSVSRLDNRKDILGLIEGYKIAKDQGLKEKLYIIGEGNDRKEIEKLINKINLEKEVILLGLKKNPYIWMKNSKYFILNSRWEGLPTVLIESLILGKSMISTACPTGPKEILENGKNGILVSVGDYKKLSSEMLRLSRDNDLRKKYEKNGYASIDRFSKEETLRKLIKIIEK